MSFESHLVVDEQIRDALNAPLGDEQPPSWSVLVERARAPRRSRRRVWAFSVGTVAAACAVVALLLLLLPGRHNDLLENAAAAIPAKGPVLHLVYRPSPVTQQLLDPATGHVHAVTVMTRDELWYDPARHLYKEIRRFPGTEPGASDVLWRSSKEAYSAVFGRQALSGHAPGQALAIQVPPEAALFSRYRQALASHEASYGGSGTLDGHPVLYLWIYHCVLAPFPGHPGSSLGCTEGTVDETIAIDKKTLDPVAVYPGTDTARGPGFRIESVSLIPRSEADLGMPARTPFPPAMTPGPGGCPCATVDVRTSKTLAPDSASAWLARPAAGLRGRLDGLPLEAVRGDSLNPAGLPVRHGVELIYGSSCKAMPRYGGDYVLVQESRTPEFFYGTQATPASTHAIPLESTYSHFAECNAEKIGFYASQDRSERIWTTAFRKNGLYVSVSSRSRQRTIAATRQILSAR